MKQNKMKQSKSLHNKIRKNSPLYEDNCTNNHIYKPAKTKMRIDCRQSMGSRFFTAIKKEERSIRYLILSKSLS